MKRLFLCFCVLGLSFVAYGQSVSDLLAKFQARDAIKLNADQGGAISFLNAVKYAPQGIQSLELTGPGIFYFQDRNGDVCKADIGQVLMQCRNEIGLLGFTFTNDPKAKFNPSDDASSDLAVEFKKREAVQFTIDQQIAIAFLTKMEYHKQGIIELEMIDQQTFVIADRNGNICLGDIGKAILRCKNEMGLTGVSFQGDAD